MSLGGYELFRLGHPKLDSTNIKQIIKSKLHLVADHVRSHAVEGVEWEYMELEHVFSLLVLGSFVGLPSPPMQISLDLLPHMEKNLLQMIDKIDTASGPLSELTSILNVT